MRLIEQQMNQAIADKTYFFKDNTEVTYYEGVNKSYIRLYGHCIAVYHHSSLEVNPNLAVLAEYPTATTKSRLRALDVNVYTKAHITYVDDVAVNA